VRGVGVEGFDGLWGVAARELRERGPGFAVARALDGAVLLIDARGLGEGRLGVVAGRVGAWMRSVAQRFFVDMALACLDRGEGRGVAVGWVAGGGGGWGGWRGGPSWTWGWPRWFVVRGGCWWVTPWAGWGVSSRPAWMRCWRRR